MLTTEKKAKLDKLLLGMSPDQLDDLRGRFTVKVKVQEKEVVMAAPTPKASAKPSIEAIESELEELDF